MTTITVAYGDGIGPEIMEATLRILKEAKADITVESIEVGEGVYNRGFLSGISQDSLHTIKRNKVFLKSPITTPQGGGYKSLNVNIRKAFGLYANVRPCKSFYPYVGTKHPNLNLTIIRENEEDVYAGVEYRQTRNLYQSLKIITRIGCERIIRFAFEYAKKNERKKVTCLSKDNIMKFTDGIFHKVFDEISANYPDIANEHYIVDIGAARIATVPEQFDVIVTSNLYGDIVSDIAAEAVGSVGLAGSANIGDEIAMFEAVHGSAPKMAGKDSANPSGLLNAAIMMLAHIGQEEIADKISSAWLKTLEDGVHTSDIYQKGLSKAKVGTNGFANAVIENLGAKPKQLVSEKYHSIGTITTSAVKKAQQEKKVLVGVDVFIDLLEDDVEKIAQRVESIADGELKLHLISRKGLKIWPSEDTFTPKVLGDHWRLRFMSREKGAPTSHDEVVYLINKIQKTGIDFIQVVNLYTFDSTQGFALAHGE